MPQSKVVPRVKNTLVLDNNCQWAGVFCLMSQDELKGRSELNAKTST